MSIVIVNIKEPHDVYGGRPRRGKHFSPIDCKVGEEGWLGNPFPMQGEHDRIACIEKHKRYFLARMKDDPVFREAVRALRGKRVACFCQPKSCHLDNIKAYLDAGCSLAPQETK